MHVLYPDTRQPCWLFQGPVALQVVKGFSQIAAQKKQLGFLQKQQASTTPPTDAAPHQRARQPPADDVPTGSQSKPHQSVGTGSTHSTATPLVHCGTAPVHQPTLVHCGTAPVHQPTVHASCHFPAAVDALQGSSATADASRPWAASLAEGSQQQPAVNRSIPAQPASESQLAVPPPQCEPAGNAQQLDPVVLPQLEPAPHSQQHGCVGASPHGAAQQQRSPGSGSAPAGTTHQGGQPLRGTDVLLAQDSNPVAALGRPCKKRNAPEPNARLTDCSEPDGLTTESQHARQTTQHKQRCDIPASTSAASVQAANSRAPKRASTASRRPVDAVPKSRATKATSKPPLHKSGTAGKACPARHAAMEAAQRDSTLVSKTGTAGKGCTASPAEDGPHVSKLQHSQPETMRRRSLRTPRAKAAAVVDRSSGDGSPGCDSDFADWSSAGGSDPDQNGSDLAGNVSELDQDGSDLGQEISNLRKAARRRPASKAGMRGQRLVGVSHATAGANSNQQFVSSTDGKKQEAAAEEEGWSSQSVVGDSDADNDGDSVVGDSKQGPVAKSGKARQLPPIQKRTGTQQAKQAAAVPGRGGRGGASAGRGGHRRTATRQNFVRCNLKASLFWQSLKATLHYALILVYSYTLSFLGTAVSVAHVNSYQLFTHELLLHERTPLGMMDCPLTSSETWYCIDSALFQACL